MEYELWAAIVLLFIVAFHTTSGFVGPKMSLVDFAEFQSIPDELKKLYYSTMTMVAPEAMKLVKPDDIKRTSDAALIQIKKAQLPGVNAVPILTPAPTVQGTVDGWKGPMEAAKTKPDAKATPVKEDAKADAKPDVKATPVKADAKPDAKTDVKAAPLIAKADAKTDVKAAPDAKADAKAAPVVKADEKKDGFNKLWILLAILLILAGGYVKYKYF
jgi:hypothetical protein